MSSFDFKIEFQFQNLASILKSIFDWFSNGTSIWKGSFHLNSSFSFKIDLPFQDGGSIWNRASVPKWSFDLGMEFQFQYQASISKSSFDFKIQLQFLNRVSISERSFDLKVHFLFSFVFKIKLQFFWNRSFILKLKLDFEIETPF